MSNDDFLSQEEIDALLRQSEPSTSGGEISDKPPSEHLPATEPTTELSANSARIENALNEMEMDALGEIGNISFSSSATTLSTILSQKVTITTPRVRVLEKYELMEEFRVPYVVLQVEFTAGLYGTNLLILNVRDAKVIANVMMGGSGRDIEEAGGLSELEMSAVQEAMNQMMGTAATSMATFFQRQVNISPPHGQVVNFHEKGQELDLEDWIVQVSFSLTIGELVDSNIMQLIPFSFAKEMVSYLFHGDSAPQGGEEKGMATSVETTAPEAGQVPSQPAASEPASSNKQAFLQLGTATLQPATSQPGVSQAAISQPTSSLVGSVQENGRKEAGLASVSLASTASEHEMNRTASIPPLRSSPPPEGFQPPAGVGEEGTPTVVQKAAFAPLKESGRSGEQALSPRNLDILLDVPMQISVELGRSTKTVQEILDLAPGSVVELNKQAGEPVDIYVNEKLIARGEVVVIDENFGVRVTDILEPRTRISQLNG